VKIVLAKHHVTEPIRLTDANKVYEKKEQKERIQIEKKKASKQFKDNLDLRFAGGKKEDSNAPLTEIGTTTQCHDFCTSLT
jgi:hypothetical protein